MSERKTLQTKITKTFEKMVEQGDHAAVEILRAALKENPDDFKLNEQMGIALFNSEDYEEARPYLSKAAALKPRSMTVIGYLGDCLYEIGEYENALPCLLKSIKKHPGDGFTLMKIGMSFVYLERSAEAYPYLRRAFEEGSIGDFDEDQIEKLVELGVQSLKPG